MQKSVFLYLSNSMLKIKLIIEDEKFILYNVTYNSTYIFVSVSFEKCFLKCNDNIDLSLK